VVVVVVVAAAAEKERVVPFWSVMTHRSL